MQFNFRNVLFLFNFQNVCAACSSACRAAALRGACRGAARRCAARTHTSTATAATPSPRTTWSTSFSVPAHACRPCSACCFLSFLLPCFRSFLFFFLAFLFLCFFAFWLSCFLACSFSLLARFLAVSFSIFARANTCERCTYACHVVFSLLPFFFDFTFHVHCVFHSLCLIPFSFDVMFVLHFRLLLSFFPRFTSLVLAHACVVCNIARQCGSTSSERANPRTYSWKTYDGALEEVLRARAHATLSSSAQ